MKLRTILILFLFIFLLAKSNILSHDFLVIVNKENPIEKISKYELRNIYLGNTIYWQNDSKIQIVDYFSESELRENFSNKYLFLSPNKVSMIWLKVTLSGKVSPPKIFYKEKDILKFVAENKSAIAYISKNTAINSDVKIIEVE